LLRRILGAVGQVAHFVGHHGKATAGLTGAGASMAALSASRLVCWEMLVITSRIWPMFTVLLSVSMLPQDR
jgi:hypothetical protein